METPAALAALAALSNESRLAVFRLLVQAGTDGMTVGAIADALDLPNATLSFHLKTLVDAGLVTSRQQGRYIRCSAEYSRVHALVGFLTANCCGGAAC